MNKLRITTFCIIQLLLFSSNLSAQNISIANISPSKGYFDRFVEISGSGFSSNAANLEVWFGAATGTIVSASENLIICKIPAGATTATITVLNKTTELSASSSAIFHEVYQGETNPDLFSLDNYNIPNANELFDLIIVDLDKDGNNDIMATKWQGSVTDVVAYRNTTNGSNISFVEQNITIGTASLRLAAGDIDGDSKQDVIITRYGTSKDRIYVLRNTSTPGAISFAAPDTFQLKSSQSANRIAIRDLDLDGRPEVVVVNSSDDEISIYLNNSTAGTINLISPPTIINSGATTGGDLVIEDFNGDGKHDIAATQFASNDIRILPNNSTPGALKFDLPTVKITLTGAVNSIAAGDIDEDGKIDLVVTDEVNDKAAIILNSSTVAQISFDNPIEKTGISDGANVALADFLGNGRLDIIISSTSASNFTLIENLSSAGSLNLLPKLLVPQPNRSRGVVAGDLSGDSKPDLAFTAIDAGGSNYFLMAIRNTICVAPKIISDASPAICNGQTFRFLTAPVPGANFIWKKDGIEVKNSADPFYDATVAGNFTVTEGACSIESAAETLILNTGAIPVDPLASNNSPACLGGSVTLSSTTVSGATYIWTGPKGYTSTDQNPIITNITADMAGTYSVRAILSPCRSEASITLVEIINPPDVTLSAGSSTNICAGESVSLSVGAATGYTYQWYNGASLITGATSNTYAANAVGSYTVNMQGVSNSCDLTSNSIEVTTFSAPIPVFSFSSPQCEGSAITFTETTAVESGETPIYSWDFDGDGTEDSNLQNPTFTYSTFGIYTVELTIGYQGHTCTGITPQSITVLMPAPIITITPDNALITRGDTIQLTASSAASSYEWTPTESLNNSSIADPLAFPVDNTTYQVVSTDANACVGMAEVVITVENRKELIIDAPKMFSPNKDTYADFWVIEDIRNYPECTLTIFTRNGKIILETLDYQDDWQGFDDDGNEMPEGAYYYTITCPDGLSASGSVSIIR